MHTESISATAKLSRLSLVFELMMFYIAGKLYGGTKTQMVNGQKHFSHFLAAYLCR